MSKMNVTKRYLEEIIRGERSGWRAFPMSIFLAVLSMLYRLVIWVKYCFRNPCKLPVAVISVGNLTAGGTGKTPTVIALVKGLCACGYHPAVLTRGYGGELEHSGLILHNAMLSTVTAQMTGDEPYLLAKTLPNTPIAIGCDRIAMANRVLREFSQTDVFVLDDGFQHWKIFRDFDLVLLNALQPFANGHVLPHGLLREPLSALRRADAVLLTGVAELSAAELSKLQDKVRFLSSEKAVFNAAMDNSTFTSVFGETEIELTKNATVAAITAIGNPERFKRALQRTGIKLELFETFPDHYSWGEREIQILLQKMKKSNLNNLIVTGKDAVKMMGFRSLFEQAKIELYVLELQLIPEAGLLQLITERLKK